MPIKSITLAVGATGMTPVGGTGTLFTEDDVKVNNGVHVSNPAVSFLTRPNISFRSRPPVLQPDGSWSKAKRMVTAVIPKTLADGSTSFTVFRGEVEAHPECSSSEVVTITTLGVQAFLDSEAENFLVAGSLT